MTKEEMIAFLKLTTEEENEVILSAALSLAGSKIINKAFPFKNDVTEVPLKYQDIQLEIATYIINKQGAEGETTHNENGINRSYESASVPSSMLRGVIPFCKSLAKVEDVDDTEEETEDESTEA